MQVLQRGQEISKRTWGILRVAVVELRGATFLGRVWFGDQATGQVAWDCDCRPSDACWLALKARHRAAGQGPGGGCGSRRGPADVRLTLLQCSRQAGRHPWQSVFGSSTLTRQTLRRLPNTPLPCLAVARPHLHPPQRLGGVRRAAAGH